MCTTAQRSGFWSRSTWVRPSLASWSDSTSWQRLAQTGSADRAVGLPGPRVVLREIERAGPSRRLIFSVDVAQAAEPSRHDRRRDEPRSSRPTSSAPPLHGPPAASHPLTPAFFPDRGAVKEFARPHSFAKETAMQLGMIGLGRMGANMVRRLMKNGHTCVVYDRSAETVAAARGRRRRRRALARRLRREAEAAARGLADGPRGRRRRHASPTSRRRCRRTTRSSTAATPTTSTTSAGRTSCAPKGIHYVDVGTCGGVWGLERGYCMMIGGDTEAVQRLDPIFKTLAPGRGDDPAHAGPREGRRHRRGGLPALRPLRRRPLRQDGPQRHRVRHHGGLRRGAEHPQARQRRQDGPRRSTPRRRRCATPSTTSTTSTSPTSPRSGGAAASSPRGCWTSRRSRC